MVAGLIPFGVRAQSGGTVSGDVRSEAGKPVQFATLMLVKAADSSLVKGAISDVDGRYVLEAAASGTYRVAASLVGYKKVFSPVFSLNASHPDHRLASLVLSEDAKQLGEVKVTGRKPFIEQQPDKLVLNVENSIVASGGTALEVLEKAPGVVVDQQNDRLSLKGREGVLVMIDGKPTYLSAAEVMNLLRSTPSNSVETIEIISNPSARYDAAGTSGIINIRLKRSSRASDGTNGSLTLGAGYGRFPKYNGGLTLNSRRGAWNLYGNYNYDHREGYGGIDLERRFNDNGVRSIVEQTGYRPNRSDGHTFRAGIDFTPGKRNTFGLLLNGLLVDSRARINNDNRVLTADRVLLSSQTMINATRRSSERLAANLNYRHTFDSTRRGGQGRELLVDLDGSKVTIDPTDNLITRSFHASGAESRPPLVQRSLSPSEVTIRAGKLDYVHPLGKKARLEAGWKTSYVTSDNDVRFETRTEGAWQSDSSRTNHFVYEETIHAAYLNGRQEWKRWTLQAGLRMEQTRSTGNSITLSKIVERSYTNLFPSVFLTQKLSDKHQLQYSFSRRIDRPNYQHLNPFVYVMDPYAYFQGNPYLKPQYTNAFQVGYTYKGETTLSFGFNRTTDVITDVTEQNDRTRVTKVTLLNLDVLTNLNLNLSFPVTVARWWTTRQSVNLFRNAYDADYLGKRLTNSGYSANLMSNHSFTLPKGFSAEVVGQYNSPFVYGLNKMRGFGQVSLGVQKSLWEKKATLRLNVSDLFYTNQNRGRIAYQNMDIRFRSFYESRVVRLNFSYNFGNRNVKAARNRRTSLEDEQNRVGQ